MGIITPLFNFTVSIIRTFIYANVRSCQSDNGTQITVSSTIFTDSVYRMNTTVQECLNLFQNKIISNGKDFQI